jgi:hypothetical protein
MWAAISEAGKTVRAALGSWSRTAQCVILVTSIGLVIVGTTAGVVWAIHHLT